VRVDAFLTDCHYQWPQFDEPRHLALLKSPVNRSLAGLPTQIEGMATENKLMLLNLALRHLTSGEVYVEIGTWRGLTLAGAAQGNASVPIYACDNFSEFGGPRNDLKRSLDGWTRPGQVRFYDMDFEQFLEIAPWQPARVGVYFYDGGHTFRQQVIALERILPWLADDALVIVDDTNMGAVRSANHLVAKRLSSFQEIVDIRTPENCAPTWWNGVAVYRHRKAPTIQPLRHRFSFTLRQVFWDAIVPPTQLLIDHARRVGRRVRWARALYRAVRHARRAAARPFTVWAGMESHS
jgi:hypothetical protein